MIYFFTTSAYNYYPSAKALLNSVKKIYPNAHFSYFLVDKHNGYEPADDGFDSVFSFNDIANELNIPIESWIFRHNVMELSTAVKPFILRQLLNKKDCEAVIFLDPDTLVFSPLDSIFEALKTNSLVFTPHMCKPASDELIERELGPMMHGSLNLGFFAVKNTQVGHDFARWWQKRLEKYCIVERARGLFTDQKWINLVPSIFDDYCIVKDPSCNVATWNTFQRTITGTVPDKLKVDGSSLSFYHFAGIYSGRHEAITNQYSINRELIMDLQKWYWSLIENDVKNPLLSQSWFYDFYEDGSEVTQEDRRFFRDNESLINTFPDPFKTSGNRAYKRHYQNIQRTRLINSPQYKLDLLLQEKQQLETPTKKKS